MRRSIGDREIRAREPRRFAEAALLRASTRLDLGPGGLAMEGALGFGRGWCGLWVVGELSVQPIGFPKLHCKASASSRGLDGYSGLLCFFGEVEVDGHGLVKDETIVLDHREASVGDSAPEIPAFSFAGERGTSASCSLRNAKFQHHP